MGALRTLISLTGAAILIQFAAAATYTVGGSNGGWDTSTNLQSWAAARTFSVGDTIVFQYSPNHDVTEVNKPDYDSCQATNPIQKSTGGSTTISLDSPGKRYFICSTPGHCLSGMKLQVDTLAASSSTPPEAAPTAAPSSSPLSSPTPPEAAPTAAPSSSPLSSPAKKAVSPSPSLEKAAGPGLSRTAPSSGADGRALPTISMAMGLMLGVIIFF